VGESGWFAVGLVVGLLVGLPIGWLISQVLLLQKNNVALSSVVFERDEDGNITAIHYVPGVRSG
jgi:hypothetical protein